MNNSDLQLSQTEYETTQRYEVCMYRYLGGNYAFFYSTQYTCLRDDHLVPQPVTGKLTYSDKSAYITNVEGV